MRKLKKFLLTIAFVITVIYLLFLYVLPKVLSSHLFLEAVDDFVADKTGIIINSEKLSVKTYPNLLIDISADKLILKSNNIELLKIKNALLTFDLKQFKTQKTDIDYIYVNQNQFENIINLHKKKKAKTLKFKINTLPQLNVKKAEVWIEKGINSIFIDIDNININNHNGISKCTFEAELISNRLKNIITIGKNGYLYLENKQLYANNLEVLVGISKLNIDGKIIDSNQKTDFSLLGKDIPVSDVMAFLLYLQKSSDKSKKFIENFYDYDGKIQVDLRVNEGGIFGNCDVNNLSGKTVLFNVPILFKFVQFKFNGRSFGAGAYGNLGGEKVYTDFISNNIASVDFETIGNVHSNLTNKVISKYIPDTSLIGSVDVSVKYKIKNKKIDVKYYANIPKNSDIYYKNAHLGLIDTDRKMYVQTFKDGETINIKTYHYSINKNGVEQKIITGVGSFERINDKYLPQFITCQTLEDTPISVAGSFYKYLKGGVFSGNLKYDFNKNKITGDFNIKNSMYKDYKIDNAQVLATEDKITVKTDGKYKKSDFLAKISAANNITDKLHIYNLYLFLDELVVNTAKKQHSNNEFNEEEIKKQTNKFDIDKYTLLLNKIKYKKAILQEILINGSVKNEIFNFETENVKFAKGSLSAKGMYDFSKRISELKISADNIDSSIAADELLELPEQIKGVANARLNIKTKNGILEKYANAKFSIKKGYLPKLGSSSFIIKNSKFFKQKFTLQDIINIDISDEKIIAADIQGRFDIENEKIKNINITSSQKFLAMLIQGNYDREKQYANIRLYGKYNKKEISKIRIFFIPLPWIIKFFLKPEHTYGQYQEELNCIPMVEAAQAKDIKAFRVTITGKINENNNINLEMKSIH